MKPLIRETTAREVALATLIDARTNLVEEKTQEVSPLARALLQFSIDEVGRELARRLALPRREKGLP